MEGRCRFRGLGQLSECGAEVAQTAEAFLSKLMACSYSAAGLAVFSGNPADHLLHRMTHRVVRGTLLACGRPDGRLVALSNAEQSVCLAVNQASGDGDEKGYDKF